MKDSSERLYRCLPADLHKYVSLNVLLSEKVMLNDGIKKKIRYVEQREYYYNKFYRTRIFKRIKFYKILCLNLVK